MLVPPTEYDCMIYARQRCGIVSNCFDHLFSLALCSGVTADRVGFLLRPIEALLCKMTLTETKIGSNYIEKNS